MHLVSGCVHELSCREVTELLPLNISWGVNTGRGESLKGTNVLSTPIHIAVIFMKQDDAICCFPVLSEWILLPQCRVLDLCNQFVRHLSMPPRRSSKVIKHMSHLMFCIYSNLLTHLLCTCSRSFVFGLHYLLCTACFEIFCFWRALLWTFNVLAGCRCPPSELVLRKWFSFIGTSFVNYLTKM